MATLNDDFTQSDGNRLREKAQHDADLIRFMLQNADAAAWARVDELGFAPPTFTAAISDWIGAMNKQRIKLAATKAEADELIRLARALYGDGEHCLDYLKHALFDPVWALRNLRVIARDKGLLVEI